MNEQIILPILQRFVAVTPHEVHSTLRAFGSFLCVLCSYFLLLPLREEAGISLGTSTLPTLFAGSLLLTLVVSPVTSLFLSRPNVRRDVSLRQFFNFLGVILLGFYAVYIVAGVPISAQEGRPPQRALQQSNPLAANATDRIKLGDASLTRLQRGVRSGFYLWVNVQNLVAVSSLWVRCADSFSPDAGARLFGFISAGATLGQLCGSLMSMAMSRTTQSQGSLYPLLLVSSGLLFVAGQLACRLGGSLAAKYEPTTAPHPLGKRAGSSPRSSMDGGSGAGDTSGGVRHGVAAAEQLRELLQGFVLIWRSSYLRMLCMFLALHYTINSLMYFVRSLVVATEVTGATQRTAFFATVNSYSAVIISVLQLTATGRLLQLLGLPVVMCLGPLLAMGGLALISAQPTTTSVAAIEVARKVVQYSVSRPAREVLFTVVSREEKYKAKLCIDTIVQRLGDALAAAAFDVLDVQYNLGTRGIVLLTAPLSSLWLLLAWRLGRRQQEMAAAQPTTVEQLLHTA